MLGPDEVYTNAHIYDFTLPDFGKCEIIVEPYSPYPKFAIVQLSTDRILCRISMLEPIYVEEDSNSVRLNQESKCILNKTLLEYKYPESPKKLIENVWKEIRLLWICTNDEDLNYKVNDPPNIPDYTKLPD